MTEAACNVCDGTGEHIKQPCTHCKGAGRERAKRHIQVQVPAGVPHGARLNLQGQADVGEMGGPSGDLLVTVKIQPHQHFSRQDNDVIYKLDVSFPLAALGTELSIPTLDGPVKLKVPSGTQSGNILRLKAKGIPHLRRSDRRGDQLVQIHVQTPEKLSKQQRELLEQLQQSFEQR
jgi:molecular chaperone DnaJ